MTRDEFDALPVGSVVYSLDRFLGTVEVEYTKRDDGWEGTCYDDSIYSPVEQGVTQSESHEFSDGYLQRLRLKAAVEQDVA